jgi:protein-S-isoprenylcysteine O-methyltransferase Ste14
MSNEPDRSFFRRGGAWVLGQLCLMAAIVAGGVFWPGQWAGTWWWRGAALAVAAFGAVFLFAGLAALGRGLTIFPEPPPGGELVRTGVYSVVRHPLYTSVVFCSLGWALWWQSPVSLAAWALAALFLDAKARYEERRLAEIFPEYPDYAARTKRLIPWLY